MVQGNVRFIPISQCNNAETKNKQHMKTMQIELLIDSRNGVYIPQILGKMILNNELRLKDNCFKENVINHAKELIIDNEFYWDEMNDLLGKLTILDADGNEYYVDYGDSGDLFAVPIGMNIYEEEI